MDQILLLETLKAIVTVAKTENNVITKEEIKRYMKESGLVLEEDKFAFIYQYLGENGVAVEGFDFEPVEKQVEEPKNLEKLQEPQKAEDAGYLKMYLSDLESISTLNENEKRTLWTEMKNGNKSATNQLMEGYFHEVVKIAKEYQDKGVLLEDLIQEGNIALIQSFESINQFGEMERADGFLKAGIREHIEELIDMEVNDSDWENTLLAKINLIHEAARHLAKELGHTATIQELADYTKMAESEIKDIQQLSKEIL